MDLVLTAIVNNKNKFGETVYQSMQTGARCHQYASDAAGHVFSLHYYNKPYSEFELVRPSLIEYFKSYGLE